MKAPSVMPGRGAHLLLRRSLRRGGKFNVSQRQSREIWRTFDALVRRKLVQHVSVTRFQSGSATFHVTVTDAGRAACKAADQRLREIKRIESAPEEAA